jgi:hypothetical protein
MEPEKKSNGGLFGTIIIIIILVLGGLYMWQSKVESPLPEDELQSESVTSSDESELSALEGDVNGAETNVGVDVETLE